MRGQALSVLGALELQRDGSRAGPNGVNNEEGGHDRTDRQDPFYGGRKLPLNGTLIRIARPPSLAPEDLLGGPIHDVRGHLQPANL